MRKIISASVLALVSTAASSMSIRQSTFITKWPSAPAIDYKIHYYASCIKFSYLKQIEAPYKDPSVEGNFYDVNNDPYHYFIQHDYTFDCEENVMVRIASQHQKESLKLLSNFVCNSDEVTIISRQSLNNSCEAVPQITKASSEPFTTDYMVRYSICVEKAYMDMLQEKGINGGRYACDHNINVNVATKIEAEYIASNEEAACSGEDLLLVSANPITKCEGLTRPNIVVIL